MLLPRANHLINVDATNASNIFTNFQTIKNTQLSSGNAIYITGTINLLENEGTIESTGAGTGNKGIRLDYGTLNTLANSGKIEGNNDYAISLEGISTVGTITNENTGDIYALSNGASSTIGSIENRGNILASSSNNKGAITNLSNIKGITLIRNDGNITAFNSTSNHGIYNDDAKITTIENNGTISSAYASGDIYNKGTIETLINGQGGSDALVFRGNLPTNYEIKISNTDYGKLEGFRLTGTGTTNFSINEDSDLSFGGIASSSYDSTDILNPAVGIAYKINSDKAITVFVNSSSTVTGPNHNLSIDDADSLSITIDSNVVYKNEAGEVNANLYEDVLIGIPQNKIANKTGTNTLDNTDVSWELTNYRNTTSWDLNIVSGSSPESGQVIHIDDAPITNITIDNKGTIWSTENNAIAFDGTEITGQAAITNASGATIRSDSTNTDEAAVVIKDTTGTLNINNEGTMMGPNGLLVDNANVTFTNRGTVTGSHYDINNAGTLIINNLQGASTSNPLTLTGNLPSYYVIIESTSNYGQLAVTNGTGTLDFNVADPTKLDTDVTYANVLSGVSDEQIADLAKTFTRSGETYEWQLEQTSNNVWHLDIASLEEIMEDNAITFPNYINKVNATLNHGIAIANFAQQNYQCNVFGENDGCFAVAGRYTDLSDPSGESQAAVFMAGYQVPEQNVRFSVFVDQSIDNRGVAGVKLENHGPMVGFKGVWQQNYDGTGMIFSVANTYQSQDAKITRKVRYFKIQNKAKDLPILKHKPTVLN